MHCAAHLSGKPEAYPGKKPNKQLPTTTINLLMLLNEKNEVLLEKRPPVGIWGGLWSLPECPSDQDIRQFCKQQHCQVKQLTSWPTLRHTFSPLSFGSHTCCCARNPSITLVMESTNSDWYKVAELETKGFAAPVKKLLRQLISGNDYAYDSLHQTKTRT